MDTIRRDIQKNWLTDVNIRDRKNWRLAVSRATCRIENVRKRPRRRPMLIWQDTIKRGMQALKIEEERITDNEKGNILLPRTERRVPA